MELRLNPLEVKGYYVNLVESISGQNIFDCYHCGKCIAGCPVADSMDIKPQQVLRYLQLGKVERLLNTNTMWICAACITCTVRCPKGIDIAAIMEALRMIKLRENYDRIHPNRIPQEDLEELPPIALVSAFRKLTP